MNTTLNADLELLKQLNSEVENSRGNIESTFKNINSACSDLKANIKGTQLNNSITSISNNIDAIDAKMSAAFEQLITFLNNQIQGYSTTYQSAAGKLAQALSFIDSNF